MSTRLKIGILRETKNPPDRRVPLTPPQIVALEETYPDVEFFVQPSDSRCYADDEYDYLGIPLKEDLRECDILLGVKEVDKRTLLRGKTYMYFAHVAKKQPHNLEMFREIIKNEIRLIDYEYLTTDRGQRLVAFGRHAGIVGAYNAIRARGIKTNRFKLKPAYQCHDLEEMWAGLRLIQLLPGLKILVTGEGRVSGGIMETLGVLNLVQVSPEEYLTKQFDIPVMCQIGPQNYVKRRDGGQFDFSHFAADPAAYDSDFYKYTTVTDILITGHFWDPRSPLFITNEDMRKPEFRISIIADISCDVNGPIASTLRASTIADPFYGYNPETEQEEPAFSRLGNITVMAVDNLPGELPREASQDFGKQLMSKVIHDLFTNENSGLIKRATITEKGLLTSRYSYLEDYLAGKL